MFTIKTTKTMKITISCENDEEFAHGVSKLVPAIGEIAGGLVAVYIEKGDCSWIDATNVPLGSEVWEREVVNIVRDNVGLMRRGSAASRLVVSGAEYLASVEDRTLDMMMDDTSPLVEQTVENLTPNPSPSERGERIKQEKWNEYITEVMTVYRDTFFGDMTKEDKKRRLAKLEDYYRC